jgi:adenylate kinase
MDSTSDTARDGADGVVRSRPGRHAARKRAAHAPPAPDVGASERLARRALGLTLDPTVHLDEAASSLVKLPDADATTLDLAGDHIRSASPDGPIAAQAVRALAIAAGAVRAGETVARAGSDAGDGADRPGPLRLVVLGPPGAGKGTQSERLAQRFGLVHVSTGDLLRASTHDAPARRYMERGELVPDSVVVELLATRLAQHDVERRGFVLDGYPRTLDQVRTLDGLIAPLRIDRVIELDVDAHTARPRLHRRGRDDDTPSTIEHRFAHYERETRPISRCYEARHLLLHIDGRQAIDAVTARLLRHLEA